MNDAELSPAERYARNKLKNRHPLLAEFAASLRIGLDPFQVDACAALEDGQSVLVAAPTGAGKTLVAEFALFLAMRKPKGKVFYTAPIKALSNQKFAEFSAEYGSENVGLLTGDTNINPRARIVVMTTEVLRNMLYAERDLLDDLSFVVMDEVHYLADRFRGAVWEEVIIHLPQSVRMVSLSATVSNAEEFGDWLHTVRGSTSVIVSEDRPVPLDQHVLVRSKLVDLFDGTAGSSGARVNPELVQLARGGAHGSSRAPFDRSRGKNRRGNDWKSRGPASRSSGDTVARSELIEMLREKNLLPAIFFIFSRFGCDQAVKQTLRAGVRLTNASERDEIRAIVEDRCRTILDEDLAVLGYWEWLDALTRGVAAHHAGLLPAFKEVVEELFQRKLVKLVFATETLALGINMPARTVVLEKLDKYNGESRVPITPGEYTQLTGRAGRRGIDVEGHSVIQWRNGLDPTAIASLASRRSYPLNSSFRPTYNMAVNLIQRLGRERTRQSLESSFAQFQADRAVVDFARRLKSQEESLAGYEKSMTCDRGDFTSYAALRRTLSEAENAGHKKASSDSRAERERRTAEIAHIRKQLRQHPVHTCPDREQHARWAERWWKLRKDTDRITAQIASRTGAIAKVFDRIVDVLSELGYLSHDDNRLQLTQHGAVLARIYGDRDLLVAECLRRDAWKGLDAAGMATMACALMFEPRRDEPEIDVRSLPRGGFREALDKTQSLLKTIQHHERENRLPVASEISLSLCRSMYSWARGASLDYVLEDSELAAGDFVRVCKQTIDLLDQLQSQPNTAIARTANDALELIRRGIVAYSSVA